MTPREDFHEWATDNDIAYKRDHRNAVEDDDPDPSWDRALRYMKRINRQRWEERRLQPRRIQFICFPTEREAVLFRLRWSDA